MVSKTKMTSLVRAFNWKEVQQGLDESPDLIEFRDNKGRSFLHICCMVNIKKNKKLKPKDSIKVADLLIERGLDASEAAFHRHNWKATPLWHAISQGENLELASFLLKQGCDPEHCLWSAAFSNNAKAVELLIRQGAEIDPIYESDKTTPLLVAVKGGHFAAAESLLALGADINYQDPQQRTPLHWALKNGTAAKHIGTLLRYGARGNIPDEDGRMASEIMKRKKDPSFRKMAEQYFEV